MAGYRRALDEGVERLRGILGDMVSSALQSLDKAMRSVFSGEPNMEDVKKLSDQLQFMREEVGNLAVELLARFQPLATDLRFIRSCIQVAYDFSRMGRYALDIIEAAGMAGSRGCRMNEVREMYLMVMRMVESVGRAFLRGDLELARKVRRMDDEVDELHRRYLRKLVEGEVKDDPACLISTALIMRYLERVADHSCYIADSVGYVETGKPEA